MWGEGRGSPKAVALCLAAALVMPQPAFAGSARTALGVAAGAVLGAAVLGAMANANRPQARPPKGKSAGKSSGRSTSRSAKSQNKNSGSTASAANDDPFAAPAGEAVPVSSKP